MGSTLLFYMLSTVLIASSMMVVSARETIHSVLFLILGFLNAAGLYVMLGAEFIGFSMVIVYVGAVAVLFLFVVMMLEETKMPRHVRGKWVALLVGGIFFLELLCLGKELPHTVKLPIASLPLPNIKAIGSVLYTEYFVAFQISGVILLVALVVAISLALKEDSAKLRFATREDAQVHFVKPPFGKGVDL